MCVCINVYSATLEEQSGKEKLVMSEDVELVTVVSVVRGRLEVTTSHVYFFDCSSNKEEGKTMQASSSCCNCVFIMIL